jgi:hypothetical protein
VIARLTIAVALAATAAFAQVVPHEDLLAIQDNSFLLEEAYNQGPGVVQHIGVAVRDTESDAWAFAFTQEWPIRSLKHQFSYSIPFGDSELGDIALNYRYQLVGSAETNLAIAPRFSLILPTGEGDNATGVQVGLPISRVLAPRVITHTNLGATWITEQGGHTEWNAGQSVIYAPNSRMQLMLEGTYTRSRRENAFVVSPAVRFAFNLANGAQIVPGIGLPIGLGDDDSRAVLFYLSYEK